MIKRSDSQKPLSASLAAGLRSWGFAEVEAAPDGTRTFVRAGRDNRWLNEPQALLWSGKEWLAARRVEETNQYRLLSKCGEIWEKYQLERFNRNSTEGELI